MDDIDKIIKDTLVKGNSLSERFNDKLVELNITQRAAIDLLGIEIRTLNGILNGTLSKLDFISLLKICNFIDIEPALGFQLYLKEVNKANKEELDTAKRNKFIVENFDLPNLKKSGFISSIKDFDEIERKIKKYFGLDSIYEYKKLNITPAFKQTKKSKSIAQVEFWINSAIKQFERIDNPNPYNKEALIRELPSFREWSIEPGDGLVKISKALYKLGVTLIIQPSLAALQVNGATIPVNNKPCIVLSDFNKSFALIWMSLLHEIFHVLFDWEEIKESHYRLSIEEDTDEREIEADAFATDYLLPPNFERILHTNYNDTFLIEQLAKKYKVHVSIVLSVYGQNYKRGDASFWMLVRKKLPPIQVFKNKLNINDWDNPIPAIQNATNIKNQISS